MYKSINDNNNLAEIINRKLIVCLRVSIRNPEALQTGHLLTDYNFVNIY